MSKIIDAEDILSEAQGCVECIYMSASELTNNGSNPIQTVANIASEKLGEAIALLAEYLHIEPAGAPRGPEATLSDALAQAIERCEAAQAAYSAGSDSDVASQLSCAESDAIDALAEMPCTSDAEFLEKLRFLLARETNLWGSPAGNMEFGPIAVAVDRYFSQAKPA